jgi:hypothetical protein
VTLVMKKEVGTMDLEEWIMDKCGRKVPLPVKMQKQE